MITFEEIRSKLKPLRWIDSHNSDGDPIKWATALRGMSIEAYYSDFLKAWFAECIVVPGLSLLITTKAKNLEEVESEVLDWVAEKIIEGLEQ